MPPEDEKDVKAPVESSATEKDEASREVPQNEPGSSERTIPPETEKKEEVAKEQPESSGKDVTKLEEQVANLNTALKQERDSKQAGTKESNDRIEKLEKQLEQSQGVITRLEGVFKPEEQKEQEPKYITQDQLTELLEKQKQELEKTTTQKQQEDAINKEIVQMESTWDGKDGKPKYTDQEVLEWQRENNLLHLSPQQAFNQKFHNEIVDWEVKQRMSNSKKAEDVEQPSSTPSQHEPEEKTPMTEQETTAAVLEAMNKADEEM